MTVRNLKYMFAPRSVAVIGASHRTDSIGYRVTRNLIDGGFEGPIMPVNPKHDAIAGLRAWKDVAAMPETPDLAVVCIPPQTVPGVIAELGARGTRAAVVITAGLSALTDETGRNLEQAMLDAARPHTLRILGPNCVGLLSPGVNLNASFAHAAALPGRLAFVSQSGGVCTAVLDWARSRGIGFSQFISMGNSADVDFGDALDYLADDPETEAILLYIESVSGARKFISAARAAARNKPILAIKAGRVAEGARAASSHTGALAGADEVYDAAFRRSGIVRVLDIDELFDAVETLALAKPCRGDRLAILSNAGGPGVLATDILVMNGGNLAELGAETLAALDAVLPPTWSRANPVDIIGDASAQRYRDALDILMQSPDADAVLFIHAPTAIVDSDEIARGLVEPLSSAKRPVFASWLGADAVAEAKRIFEEAGIPTYDSPEDAARAFLHLTQYHANQQALMEVPRVDSEAFPPDGDAVRRIIDAALQDGRDMLSEAEAKALLAAYGVPVVETQIASTPGEAAAIAKQFGFPVAVKILSPDITHKSDVGGVALDLESAAAVEAAATDMARRLETLQPGARLTGYTVQPMARRPGAHELIVGATVDPTFGPIVLFGQGGTAVEVIADRAVALPPLNLNLADGLIARTRVSGLLAGYRNVPPADRTAIQRVLVQVSRLVADFAEIVELDINPLLADKNGVIALDARVRVQATDADPAARLCIRPYPKALEFRAELGEQDLCIRPVRPEDEPLYRRLIESLEPQDSYFRFFSHVKQLSPKWLARLTQIDYDREMAFLAIDGGREGNAVGAVRVIFDPDHTSAEFAVLVHSRFKGRGLGRLLMTRIIDYCRDQGAHEIMGRVLPENRPMLQLMRGLGFELHTNADERIVEARLPLQAT